MVAHYTAAALGKYAPTFCVIRPRLKPLSDQIFYVVFLVSESKVLCHPSSVDSLSTSAGTEDHVSMGGFSARKAVRVVENVERGTSEKVS